MNYNFLGEILFWCAGKRKYQKFSYLLCQPASHWHSWRYRI